MIQKVNSISVITTLDNEHKKEPKETEAFISSTKDFESILQEEITKLKSKK